MRLRMEGYGDAGEYGAPSGDLYIEISVAPHKAFTRRGDNLETGIDITPAQVFFDIRVIVLRVALPDPVPAPQRRRPIPHFEAGLGDHPVPATR